MNWIFIASLQHFRLHDFIRDYGFVEFKQKDKVQIGDIVYLYITAPYKRVEYKMVVERINISSHDAFDDTPYSLIGKQTTPLETDKAVRLKYVDRVQTDDLCFSKLREHGFKATMQTNRHINEEVVEYIEGFFNSMGNIKIVRGVFDTKLELEHAGVAAGFPSPADDYRHETLDFNRDYIRHPEASFYGDVEGDSMKDAGLFDGDRVIIDRAVEPHDGSIVVAWWDGGFTMKFLDLTHKNDGYIELRPANDDYPVFRIDDPNEFQVWGVVIHLIRTFEKI